MSCSCECNPSAREPSKQCIFCDIVAGRKPDTEILFENHRMIIINDIRPASEHHLLAIPKEHIINASKLSGSDRPLVQEMETELRNVLSKKGNVDLADCSFGFHWPPFTSIPHLHMHGIAPSSKMGFLARWAFKPYNIWYCSPQYVSSQLKCTCKCHG